MKILYISPGGPTQDYMRDCVFLGLRELLGEDAVDINKLDSLYAGADRSQMYGKGFTLYGELEDIPVDRMDIAHKISAKYFDLVIFGSIHRCQDYLYEVTAKYRKHEILAIDGEDHPGYLNNLGIITFKRELYCPQPDCFPIHFAIPAAKIRQQRPTKHRYMAPCDPLNKKTYIYTDEATYYQQYADSYFGATMKKAGWDCLRHYEILANWCLPYFRVFDQLPSTICHNLPRPELMLIKHLVEYQGQREIDMRDLLVSTYNKLIGPVMEIVRTKLTTAALAEYVLNTVGIEKRPLVKVPA